MINTIIKRFASKVDSLNWQSISYQNKAFETVNDQLYKAVMEVIPKKKKLPDSGDFVEYHAQEDSGELDEKIGFNQAIEEMTVQINKLFGKGENN